MVTKRGLVKILIIIVAVYLGICLLLFLFQRSFVYHPTSVPWDRRDSLKAYDVNGVSINVSEETRDGNKALIYFGGNGQDVSGSLLRYATAFPGHGIYMVHYRGFGGSEGRPNEKALHDDAQAVYDLVRAKHQEIIVVGRSLGSGVAVRLAANNDVERVVLITPYDSILNVAKKQFPLIPVGLLLHDKFESWRFAPKVKAPTLILAAEDDKTILFQSTRALYESFEKGVANMVVFEGVGHNTISNADAFMVKVVNGH